MKKVIGTAVLIGICLASAATVAQTADPKAVTDPAPPARADEMRDAKADASDYVIGADDTLHISVWKEPELSETLPVRPDGKISMAGRCQCRKWKWEWEWKHQIQVLASQQES